MIESLNGNGGFGSKFDRVVIETRRLSTTGNSIPMRFLEKSLRQASGVGVAPVKLRDA